MDPKFKGAPTVAVERSVMDCNKKELLLHGFSDASNPAVCAAVYVTAKYWDGSASQNLVVSKSRIAPKNTSISCLELVAAPDSFLPGCSIMSQRQLASTCLLGLMHG